MGRALFAAVAALSLASSREARADARIATCVEVLGGSDREALRSLVESELDRHPSHRAARDECTSYLRVELIDIPQADGGGRFLTGRVNEQVPERVRVGSNGLEAALERLLTVVLHNDPVRLRGPVKRTWLGEQSQAFVEGRNEFALEALELFVPLDERLQTLPGFALGARREAPGWFIGLRLVAAFSPGTVEERPTLVTWGSAGLEGAVFSSPAASTSLFASVLLGFEYQRFSGPAPLLDPGARGTAVSAGFSPGLRGGVELFRVSSIRLCLSVEARLPLFLADDLDAGVVRNTWLPSAALAGGAVF